MGTRPPSSLLYVAPKVSASATAAYRAMPSRTYCISCSQSHRPGLPEGYPWPFAILQASLRDQHIRLLCTSTF